MSLLADSVTGTRQDWQEIDNRQDWRVRVEAPTSPPVPIASRSASPELDPRAGETYPGAGHMWLGTPQTAERALDRTIDYLQRQLPTASGVSKPVK